MGSEDTRIRRFNHPFSTLGSFHMLNTHLGKKYITFDHICLNIEKEEKEKPPA